MLRGITGTYNRTRRRGKMAHTMKASCPKWPIGTSNEYTIWPPDLTALSRQRASTQTMETRDLCRTGRNSCRFTARCLRQSTTLAHQQTPYATDAQQRTVINMIASQCQLGEAPGKRQGSLERPWSLQPLRPNVSHMITTHTLTQ